MQKLVEQLKRQALVEQAIYNAGINLLEPGVDEFHLRTAECLEKLGEHELAQEWLEGDQRKAAYGIWNLAHSEPIGLLFGAIMVRQPDLENAPKLCDLDADALWCLPGE
jgi:hypothetical protein